MSNTRRNKTREVINRLYESPIKNLLSKDSVRVLEDILKAGPEPEKKTASFYSPTQDTYRTFEYDLEARRQKNREKIRKHRALMNKGINITSVLRS
jgi:hypothetical protein